MRVNCLLVVVVVVIVHSFTFILGAIVVGKAAEGARVCVRVLRCVINRIIKENAASVAGAGELKRERTFSFLPTSLPPSLLPAIEC